MMLSRLNKVYNNFKKGRRDNSLHTIINSRALIFKVIERYSN